MVGTSLIQPTAASLAELDEVFGKTPGWDFTRKLNQMKFAIKNGQRVEAIQLATEAEGLGDVLLSGEAAEQLEDLFNEIRRYVRLQTFASYKAKCRDPIEDIKKLMTANGQVITSVM